MTMNYIKNIALFIVVSIVVKLLSDYLESKFLIEFLEDDLITILITVFAINTATNSLLITDLAKLAKSKEIKFKNSYEQIRIAIAEQLILVMLGFLLLIIRGTSQGLPMEIMYIVDTLLIATFVFALDILRDTALAVFKLIEFRNRE
ncbi:MAG: hypothetical protein IPJ06_17455 [Saprospiraceae bacterium]|nr:hypothetical protein [Saprospiraceae bacterium]